MEDVIKTIMACGVWLLVGIALCMVSGCSDSFSHCTEQCVAIEVAKTDHCYSYFGMVDCTMPYTSNDLGDPNRMREIREWEEAQELNITETCFEKCRGVNE